jgi:lipoprotein-anchoring transpeptidase ErfK/SrfK
VIRPRIKSKAYHIEVDKTRQILILVKGGRVRGIIPVSTGATGNTPEGTHSVLWKQPVTRALFGSALLNWVMDFHANFAIHGYPVVPPYPASHGCVREPEWIALWTYDQTPVGTPVYVYS